MSPGSRLPACLVSLWHYGISGAPPAEARKPVKPPCTAEPTPPQSVIPSSQTAPSSTLLLSCHQCKFSSNDHKSIKHVQQSLLWICSNHSSLLINITHTNPLYSCLIWLTLYSTRLGILQYANASFSVVFQHIPLCHALIFLSAHYAPLQIHITLIFCW